MRGKKLRGNGLWESHRIILPQFREAIVNHRHGLNKCIRQELDEQRIEELSAAIAEAIISGEQTAVTTFSEYGAKTMVGIVIRLDPIERVFLLKMRADTARISLSDIVNVSRF